MLAGVIVCELMWMGVIVYAATWLGIHSIIVIDNIEHKINNSGNGDICNGNENFKLPLISRLSYIYSAIV
jgi:hypothetical protein